MSIFVCPYCKKGLKEHNRNLECLQCNKTFPVRDNIPDFLPIALKPEIKRLLGFFNRLSLIYETPLWYPIICHIYGGLFIPSVKETIRMVTDMLDIHGGVVLDVACGTGLFTRSIAKRAEQVYGIDISPGMLKKAQKYARRDNLENIFFARAEVENLPFPDNFFDGVSCCGALHLFPDAGRALDEMNRVLKKAHKLAVMTFVRRRFLKIKRIYEHAERKHGIHIFDVGELESYLEKSGYIDFRCNIYGSMILFEAKKQGQ